MRTVVVGAGAAGLWCALHAVEQGSVTIVAPTASDVTATAWAQGGVAAAMAKGDSPESHARDTIAAGAGLCDEAAVKVLVHGACEAVSELQAIGMAFDAGGEPTLEGGHSARRVLHAGGDASGRELHRFLAGTVALAESRIDRLATKVRAIGVEDGRANGVELQNGSWVAADRVVLATGGATGIFGHRTGPETSVGEGLELAWRAGAALADVEFVQFHPTALDVPGYPARLLTEALRGEGAILTDASGERFMKRFHPHAELAPRDVVARAVLQVREETGTPVYLDARGIRGVARRFPTAADQCAEVRLDIEQDPIPVAPAAHYFVGGVLTDTWGRTTVPGLFAAGEVASTGVHGANRLASNSLAEALVFGARAAVAEDGPCEVVLDGFQEPLGCEAPAHGLSLLEIQDLADRFLGVRRNGPALAHLAERLALVEPEGGSPAARLVAWILAQAALRREESRGGHYRADFPESVPAWRVRQVVDHDGWAIASVTRADDPR